MAKTESFKANHLKLNPGLYVSRIDTMDNFTFTSFDLRLTKPNYEPVLNTAAAHSIEHLGATWFRSKHPDLTMCFGPLGCRTGFYLTLKGKRSASDTIDMIIDCFKFISEYEGKVPEAEAAECGNYLDHNLSMAKYHAKKYLEVLNKEKKEQTFEYPA